MIGSSQKLGVDGFGASTLASAYRLPTSTIRLPGSNQAARETIRRHCPATPGVYGMIDADREVIYVGESRSLRTRLLSYFVGDIPPSKTRRIVEHTRELVWEPTSHKFTALLRELELIRRWQPRFNVRGKPRRSRRAYVCVGRGPAAQVYLSAAPCAHQRRSFGPVPANRSYQQSVARVNDYFGLRDCRQRIESPFRDQLELFPLPRDAKCLRGAIGTCLAPCATACSQHAYGRRVAAAVEFLAGRSPEVLEQIDKQMRSAAGTQDYELAARLRDTHADLARLSGSLDRLEQARGTSFVYPVRSHVGGENWYFIRSGQVAAVAQRPSCPRTAQACLDVISRAYPWDRETRPPSASEDLDVILLVAAWFRSHPEELKSTMSPDEAMGRCREASAGPQ